MRLWIKDPLAILSQGAERGIVVEDGRIVEVVGAGGNPSAPVDETFDASRHAVIPGLVNTHHHMFQTLTRAHPAAINKELFPWLEALFPIWAKNVTPENLGWRPASPSRNCCSPAARRSRTTSICSPPASTRRWTSRPRRRPRSACA